MPELGFSLQIEVYFLSGTYEFARPDHPIIQFINLQGDPEKRQDIINFL